MFPSENYKANLSAKAHLLYNMSYRYIQLSWIYLLIKVFVALVFSVTAEMNTLLCSSVQYVIWNSSLQLGTLVQNIDGIETAKHDIYKLSCIAKYPQDALALYD